MQPIATTPEIDEHLAEDAPVAIGVSGGKDSCALAFALKDYLDSIGHRGPRLLVHSDLGRVEWADSLPTCRRLADATGMELVIVQRKAGGLMERWLGRWDNNVARYESLSCVKLILPWSTAAMRFCTSELKVDVICAELTDRFRGRTILSATGIRRDESGTRAKALVADRQAKLERSSRETLGFNWNPIIESTTPEVYAYLEAKGFPLHNAYTAHGSSRVSCRFCILASLADLKASAGCEENAPLYREMVALEIVSTFGFRSDRWLADIAPHLLSDEASDLVAISKVRAAERESAEAAIPKHLLYTKGWPTCIPTQAEARLLADVRHAVTSAVGLAPTFLDPDAIIARYEDLMREKLAREARSKTAPTLPDVGDFPLFASLCNA
jgi:3'-phosphoadenosine 5'-phosphosulfate sulfotransferase (PAPS reductase)/FAD synthetase